MKGHKAHHHHHPRAAHAKGGKAESPMHGHKVHDEAPSDVYEGAASHVVKEAKEKKHGGRAHKAKHHVEMHGHKGHHRSDRTPRKSGGKVGANMHPLSTAHHGTPAKGRGHLEMN